MTLRLLVLTLLLGAFVLPRETGFAARMRVFTRGSISEQKPDIPATNTPLETIFERLESEAEEEREGALLWLLRRNKSTELGDFAFPKHSIAFSVDECIRKQAGTILWRLVQCTYVSRMAMQSGGGEYRRFTEISYLFDDLGQLRDWLVNPYLVLMDDFNLDNKIDILSVVTRSRVVMLSYERGRGRELLNIDGVPSRSRVISRTRIEGGGEHVKYERPVEVVGLSDREPKRIKILEHGTYSWDPKRNKYERSAQPASGRVPSKAAGDGKL